MARSTSAERSGQGAGYQYQQRSRLGDANRFCRRSTVAPVAQNLCVISAPDDTVVVEVAVGLACRSHAPVGQNDRQVRPADKTVAVDVAGYQRDTPAFD